MSKVRAEVEVFGRFRDLLPPHLFDQGGELHHSRQRVGLTPDLLLRIPTPDGVGDRLGEIKVMSASSVSPTHFLSEAENLSNVRRGLSLPSWEN